MRSGLLGVLLIPVVVIMSLLRRWLARAFDTCRVLFGEVFDLCCWRRWWREPPKLHEDILHLFPILCVPHPPLASLTPIKPAIGNFISRLAPDKIPCLLNLLQRG